MKRSSIRSLTSLLKQFAIDIPVLTETALLMYIPDPRLGTKAQMRVRIARAFKNALADINVACLIIAGVCLERQARAGHVPGLSKRRYRSDPVDLLADEILGQSIAQYLAGTRALFEFERMDKMKPGILKSLPPIMDDVIAGLVSGVMVKVCSR